MECPNYNRVKNLVKFPCLIWPKELGLRANLDHFPFLLTFFEPFPKSIQAAKKGPNIELMTSTEGAKMKIIVISK